jgi:CheY-like chemotaxis protein
VQLLRNSFAHSLVCDGLSLSWHYQHHILLPPHDGNEVAERKRLTSQLRRVVDRRGEWGFLLYGEATLGCSTDRQGDTPRATRADRIKLMVVDDDPEVRVVVSEFLEDFGYHVIQASSALQALDLLAGMPDLRMIITDIRMPDMSGIDLANLATQRQSYLKIILISGYFVSQSVDRRFLRKPFRMRELEAAVREELAA